MRPTKRKVSAALEWGRRQGINALYDTASGNVRKPQVAIFQDPGLTTTSSPAIFAFEERRAGGAGVGTRRDMRAFMVRTFVTLDRRLVPTLDPTVF
jgi:hypothetical protein